MTRPALEIERKIVVAGIMTALLLGACQLGSSPLGSSSVGPRELPSEPAEILLSWSGTGEMKSDAFNSIGDHVDVRYRFDCPYADLASTMSILIYGANPAGPDVPDSIASGSIPGGSASASVDLNGSTGPFTIRVDSICSWTIDVMGLP